MPVRSWKGFGGCRWTGEGAYEVVSAAATSSRDAEQGDEFLGEASGGSLRLAESFFCAGSSTRQASEWDWSDQTWDAVPWSTEEIGCLFAKLQRSRVHLGSDACSRGGEMGFWGAVPGAAVHFADFLRGFGWNQAEAEEADHAELRIDTDCVKEGVDVVSCASAWAMPQERGRCWRWRSEICNLRRCTFQPNTNWFWR